MKQLLFISILFLTITTCFSKSNTVESKNIKTSDKRISTLSKYFNLRGNTKDAEYHIFDVNLESNRSIPGATSRDFKVAILLDPSQVKLWISDIDEISDPIDYSWGLKLIESNSNINIKSKPRFYSGINKTVITFKDDGVVLIRIVQN